MNVYRNLFFWRLSITRLAAPVLISGAARFISGCDALILPEAYGYTEYIYLRHIYLRHHHDHHRALMQKSNGVQVPAIAAYTTHSIDGS